MTEPPSAVLRDLRSLPKAHLHLHLEGAMRPATLAELASAHGIDVPPLQGDGSFATFGGMYRAACLTLQSPADVLRIVQEVAEDAAESGATWVEPALMASAGAALRLGLDSDEAYLELLLAAAAEAQRATGVGVGLMLTANRARAPDTALREAELAARYAGRGVVAFGLADDESLGPPQAFTEAFALARAAGLISAPHAGELSGATSVLGALESLGAHRIQHGVRAIEDSALVEYVARKQICLDICPTSNLVLSVVPSLEAHPLPELLAAGVPVSVNADDPLFFGSSLLEEYELCRSAFGLDDAALAQIAACSLRASGAPDHLKRAGLIGIQRWLADE